MDASIALAQATVAIGTAVAMLGIAAWLRPRLGVLRRAVTLAGVVGLAVALAAFVARWFAAGHLPLFGTYESALSLAVACFLAAALVGRRFASPGAWPVAGGVAAAVVAHGLAYDLSVHALTISERSLVVQAHGVIAWAAFGALVVNAAVALRRSVSGGGEQPRTDRLLGLSLSVGFFLHSAMLASGSLYEFLLFGRAWSFDPIETLGFLVWMAYGTLLHLHLLARWDGRRLARWCLGVFVLLIISYRAVVLFPAWSTYHVFDLDLRLHLTGTESESAE